MSGVARPPLHVGTVGEFVVLVAITQNELSGSDDAIVIQGTGISNGLFEPGALVYPEGADHRLCKAIAKPERLAQSLFLIAFFLTECAWVVVDLDDAENFLVNIRNQGGSASRCPFGNQNMRGAAVGTINIRPTPLPGTVSQKQRAQVAAHATSKRARERMRFGFLAP